MVSVTGCERAPGGRRSSIVAKRAESGSLPSSLKGYESLRNSRDFRRVLDEGTRRRIGGIVVVESPGRPGPPRLGLVVSRSCGSAVARNRIKRRLRSAARAAELEPGTDYVIIANRQVGDAPFEQVVGWLRRALPERDDA